MTVADQVRKDGRYTHISVHAPSSITEGDVTVTDHLANFCHGWPIVVHPNVLSPRWERFRSNLLIENMDNRKDGCTAAGLLPYFQQFPEARFCLDIGHARQVDPTMMVAKGLLEAFGSRLAEVHVSLVDKQAKHQRLDLKCLYDFSQIAGMIPPGVPLILETPVGNDLHEARSEASRALLAFGE